VTDRALFIAREKFLKVEAYGMLRIPLEDVKEVILSRERGPRVWLKWSLVFAFGVASMIVMAIGLWRTPSFQPSLFGTAGPIAFTIVGLSMLIDGRWRLVLTIRTRKKDYRWRPHIFDDRNRVKALREGFLAACRYVEVPTHRLDLINEREIAKFWSWFQGHASNGSINLPRVQERLHKLCDRIDIEMVSDRAEGVHRLVVTANYARDAFPIVEELMFACPNVPGVTVTAFKPRQKIGRVYRFSDTEYPLDDIFFITYTDGFELALEIYADWENFEGHEEFIWALYKDLLGEYDVTVSVRYVQLRELTDVKDRSLFKHISQLPEVVDEFYCFDLD
jgi:hypothetical protein